MQGMHAEGLQPQEKISEHEMRVAEWKDGGSYLQSLTVVEKARKVAMWSGGRIR